MKRYLNLLLLLAVSLAVITACTDSPLEDWEPYLPTGSSVPVSTSISVDKTAISVGVAAASESVVITTTDTWTATASDAWISLSAVSGTSGQTVTISIAENTTASQRTGKVTFSNAGGKSAIVNVTQEGKTLSVSPTSLNFQAEGGTSAIEITTNGNYTWNKNEIGAWLTIAQSDKGLNVTATKNQKPEQRADTLTIYLTGLTEGSISRDVIIIQYGTEYTFDIDKTSITASSAECSDAIQLSTNDAWTASASDKWITLSSTSGTGSQLININLSENKTPNERKGSVTFVGTNSQASKTVEITQSGKTLSVSPESLSFDTGGGTKTVTVTTDGIFTTSNNADWITVTTSGNSISVKASANTSTSSRTGKVTVSLTGLTSGSLSREITVTQSGTSVVAPTVSPTSISVTSAATSKSISITSNASWTASDNADWITLSSSSGSGNANLTLSIAENKTTTSRTGTVTIQNSAGSAKVTLTQDGKYLTVSPESLTFEASGGSKNVTVNTDGSFSASKSADWITITTNGNTITVKATANTSTSSRTGKVIVSLTGLSSGSLSREITVTQSGTSVVAPTVNPSSISISSAATSKSISITSNADWQASKDASWITLSSTSGSGNANLTLSIAENKTPNSRTGTVTIQNSAGSATVTVTQDGKYLNVSRESLSFDASGGTENVTIDTDGTFTTSTNVTWLTVSSGHSSITVKASENTSTQGRSGTVTVSLTNLNSGLLSRIINVQQDPSSNTNNGHEYVDLGLPSGTKWATCNVGATMPEECGGYYAWGETEEKYYYSWGTYIHCDGGEWSCYHIGDDIAGTDYDVAHVKWGGSWRMPSTDQINELIEKCTRTWTTQNGVKGILVTGPNKKTIFLPASGTRINNILRLEGSDGEYWSSSYYPNREYFAYYFHFSSNNWSCSNKTRDSGAPVRAVCP